MPEPLVSVIIPTYNREKFIAECVRSVLDQTFTDLEVIVSDDGSPDNTEAVVGAITDERVTYSRIEHVGIPSATRNNGIKQARGRYLAFLDSDDLWFPDKLERQLELIKADERIGLVCTNGINFSEEGVLGLKNRLPLTDDDFLFEALLEFNHIICSSVLVKKDVIDDVGMFDENPDLRAVEDYHLWLRVRKKYGIRYINDPLVKYRTHGDVIRQDELEANYRLMKKVFDDLMARGVLDQTQHDTALAKLEQTVEYDNLIKEILGEKSEDEIDADSLFKRISENRKITKKDKTKLIMRLMMRKISPKLAEKLAQRLYAMK